MILDLFMQVFEFEDWTLCISLELCPLIWLLGIGLETPDPEAIAPGHKLTISVPTLRLEFAWAKNEDLKRAEQLMEAYEESDSESSP